MMPMISNEAALVPSPAYHHAQARLGQPRIFATHLDERGIGQTPLDYNTVLLELAATQSFG